MPLKDYTTKVSAHTSLGEIMAMLAQAGASELQIQYREGTPTGLAFGLSTANGDHSYILPANIDGVLRVLQRDHENRSSRSHTGPPDLAQARRVGWRILHDWVDAQLAIIDAGLVTAEEVMLPYLAVGGGRTLYQKIAERGYGLLMLPAPAEPAP